jgi:hypothetical protein
VDDIAAKREVIFAGMGWGGLPEHVVADALSSGELVVLDVPEFEVGTMELFAMRRRDRAFGLVAATLWEEIRRSGADAAGMTYAPRTNARRTNAAVQRRAKTNRRSSSVPSKGRKGR